MTIQGVNAATGYGSLYQAAAGGEMSAESLLIFCKKQLDGINGEINDCMKRQEQLQATKQLLAQLKDALGAFAADLKGDGHWDNVRKAFEEAINGLPEGDPMRAALQSQMNEMWGKYQTTGPNKEQLQAEIAKVDTLFEEVKGNMEINMLRLQSAVSSKQTQMQLVTNMLSKQDQTMLSIAKNV